MSKVFLRIVAFLLVPCLVADSVLANTLSQHQSLARQSSIVIFQRSFLQENIFMQTAVVEPLVILRNRPIDVEADPISQQTRRQVGSYHRSIPFSGFWRSAVAATVLFFTTLIPAAKLSQAQTTTNKSKPSLIERLYRQEIESREDWDRIAKEEDQILMEGGKYGKGPNDVINRDGGFTILTTKEMNKVAQEDVKFFIERWLKKFANPNDEAKFVRRIGVPLLRGVQGSWQEVAAWSALALAALIFGVMTWWSKRRRDAQPPKNAATSYFSAGENESHGFIPKMLGAVVTILAASSFAWSVQPVETLRIDPLVDRHVSTNLAITSPGETVDINPLYLRRFKATSGGRLLIDHELAHFLRGFLPRSDDNDTFFAEGYAFARVLMLGGEDQLRKAIINQGIATSTRAPEAARAISNLGAAFDAGKKYFHDYPDPNELDLTIHDVASGIFGNFDFVTDAYANVIASAMHAGAIWEMTGQKLPGMNRPLTDEERGLLIMDYFDHRTSASFWAGPAMTFVRTKMVQLSSGKSPNMVFYYLGKAIGLPEVSARKMGQWGLITVEIPFLIFGAIGIGAKAPGWFGFAEPHSLVGGLVAVAALGIIVTLQNAFETRISQKIGETPSFWQKFKGFAPYLLVTWATALHVSLPLIGILSLGAALFHLHHDQMLRNLSPFKDVIQGSA